jgi:hypothetical protein
VSISSGFPPLPPPRDKAVSPGFYLRYFIGVFDSFNVLAMTGRDTKATRGEGQTPPAGTQAPRRLSPAEAVELLCAAGVSEMAAAAALSDGMRGGSCPLWCDGRQVPSHFIITLAVEIDDRTGAVGITSLTREAWDRPRAAYDWRFDARRVRDLLPALMPLPDLLPIRVRAKAPKTDSVSWTRAATRDLRDRGKIPEGVKKAELGRLLEAEARRAVKAGDLERALKASYIEDKLAAWGIWPLESFE